MRTARFICPTAARVSSPRLPGQPYPPDPYAMANQVTNRRHIWLNANTASIPRPGVLALVVGSKSSA